jgi:hypothetical protein
MASDTRAIIDINEMIEEDGVFDSSIFSNDIG